MNALDHFQFELFQDRPGLRYAIFGRAGGVSGAPFASLNVGSGLGDAPENVARNHARICESLGVRREELVTVHQVHSNRAMRVGAGDRGQHMGDLDGLLTDEPGVPLIMRFADCAPLLAYDPARHALGVAHAGWRGTLSKMGQQLVAAMVEQFGSRPADLLVGIGPSIGPCCYEVGDEVVEATRAAFGSDADALLARTNGQRMHLDLWAANRLQLEQAGVAQIETAGICTACHRERFFSHRGDGGRTGRFPMLAVLAG
jgi:polyphenol oxidase